MPFPSVLNTFNRPTTTDRLNSPSHSALHNTVSSALGQVEATIGVEGANSVVGTMMYEIRSPASDGGGHVQSANKGGTGQTSYNKGDLLVAQSSSVLSKLAVGNDGQILKINSSVASGINWVESPSTKISASASVISIINNSETSILSVTIPGSTLGTSNAIRATAFITDFKSTAGRSVLAAIQYAGGNIASVMLTPTVTDNNSVMGELVHTIIGNGATNSQRHFMQVKLASYFQPRQLVVFNNDTPTAPQGTAILSRQFNVSSVNGDAAQTIGMTITQATGSPIISSGGYIVEKIV